MNRSLLDLIALITLIIWPAIPLFWIPVHCLPRVFRRLGRATYILPLITWLPLALFIFRQRGILLAHRTELPLPVNVLGGLLLASGIALQLWTLALLTLPVIMGFPEVSDERKGNLVTSGPFSVVRHPTYLSHTMMYLGVYLLTEVTAMGVATVVDAIAVNVMVIPLEERELAARFGKEYEEYKKRAPSRFLPGIGAKRRAG
jgi:protein-S-isoprenylcysteine O-methyltransferase Ste14